MLSCPPVGYSVNNLILVVDPPAGESSDDDNDTVYEGPEYGYNSFPDETARAKNGVVSMRFTVRIVYRFGFDLRKRLHAAHATGLLHLLCRLGHDGVLGSGVGALHGAI